MQAVPRYLPTELHSIADQEVGAGWAVCASGLCWGLWLFLGPEQTACAATRSCLITHSFEPNDLQMERLIEQAYEEVKVLLQRNRAALDT